MADPHLRVFGVAELRVQGRPVRFRTRKQLALLAYLVFEARERPVFRDLVIALLWPEVSPPDARHSLSQALTAIRNVLGKEAVSRGSERMHLDCRVTTDLDVLAAGRYPHRTALGQPLEDLETVAGTEFGHWVEGTRARCLRIARDRLLEQIEGARREGHVAKVHERAALLYSVDPLCDTAALALAERFLLAGDAVGATRVLRGHLAHTQQEIGCTPNRDIVRLLRRLESGAVHTTSAPVATALAAAAAAEHDVFIGRTREIARLEATWTAARGGSLHTCLIVGPAGIGKSSLVRRFATTVASRGAPVFTVSCQEIGRGIPFATVSELIYSLSRDPEIAAADPAWLAEASRVTPGLRAVYPGIPDPPAVPPEAVRLRVAEALLCLLNTVSDSGPALLVFDDVQHMDPASRDVLHVLLRRLEGTPTFVLGTQRVTAVHPFRAGSRPADAITWEHVVEMVPFEIDEALALVAARTRTGDALSSPVRMKIVQLSQGNAYLLEMLLSDWERDPDGSLVAAEMAGHGTGATWQPPEMMRDAFGRLYRGLSVMAKHVLELLSVAGKPIGGARLGERLGESRPQIDRATLELVERGIVRLESGQIGFKNEMHRAFVYYAMSEESRKFYHLQLGSLPNDSSRDFQQLLETGHHLLRAQITTDAVRRMTEGAEIAVAQGAVREAERAVQEIVDSCPSAMSARTHLVHSSLLIAQGRYGRALEVLDSAKGTTDSPLEDATVTVRRVEALYEGRLAVDPTILRLARAALQEARTVGDSQLLLTALHLTAEIASESSNLHEVSDIGGVTQSMVASNSDPNIKASALLTHAFCQLVLGRYEAAAVAFQEAAMLFRQTMRALDLRAALTGLAICGTNVGRFDEGEKALVEARAISRRVGNESFEALALNNLGVIYEDTGRFCSAIEAYRECMELILRRPHHRRIAQVYSNAAGLAQSLGALGEADRLLETAEDAARRCDGEIAYREVLLTRADYYLACKESERAWAIVDRLAVQERRRNFLGGATGHFERLKRHYVWATQGLPAYRALPPATLEGIGNGLASRVELRALDEWILQESLATDQCRAVQDICREGLWGVLARLISIGVMSPGLPKPEPGEKPAQVVVRVYGCGGDQQVPESVMEHIPSAHC
jgi:DNA-binding SARP family transcriptional activator/tetratricopeptide (TPR) repeat protein